MKGFFLFKGEGTGIVSRKASFFFFVCVCFGEGMVGFWERWRVVYSTRVFFFFFSFLFWGLSSRVSSGMGKTGFFLFFLFNFQNVAFFFFWFLKICFKFWISSEYITASCFEVFFSHWVKCFCTFLVYGCFLHISLLTFKFLGLFSIDFRAELIIFVLLLFRYKPIFSISEQYWLGVNDTCHNGFWMVFIWFIHIELLHLLYL